MLTTTSPSLDRAKCSSILMHGYSSHVRVHSMRRSSTCGHKTSNHMPIHTCTSCANILISYRVYWTLELYLPLNHNSEDNSTQTQTRHTITLYSIYSWRFMLRFILWCVTLKMFIYGKKYIHIMYIYYIHYTYNTLFGIHSNKDSTFIYLFFYINI